MLGTWYQVHKYELVLLSNNIMFHCLSICSLDIGCSVRTKTVPSLALHPQGLEYSLKHIRCSINIYRKNKIKNKLFPLHSKAGLNLLYVQSNIQIQPKLRLGSEQVTKEIDKVLNIQFDGSMIFFMALKNCSGHVGLEN